MESAGVQPPEEPEQQASYVLQVSKQKAWRGHLGSEVPAAPKPTPGLPPVVPTHQHRPDAGFLPPVAAAQSKARPLRGPEPKYGLSFFLILAFFLLLLLYSAILLWANTLVLNYYYGISYVNGNNQDISIRGDLTANAFNTHLDVRVGNLQYVASENVLSAVADQPLTLSAPEGATIKFDSDVILTSGHSITINDDGNLFEVAAASNLFQSEGGLNLVSDSNVTISSTSSVNIGNAFTDEITLSTSGDAVVSLVAPTIELSDVTLSGATLSAEGVTFVADESITLETATSQGVNLKDLRVAFQPATEGRRSLLSSAQSVTISSPDSSDIQLRVESGKDVLLDSHITLQKSGSVSVLSSDSDDFTLTSTQNIAASADTITVNANDQINLNSGTNVVFSNLDVASTVQLSGNQLSATGGFTFGSSHPIVLAPSDEVSIGSSVFQVGQTTLSATGITASSNLAVTSTQSALDLTGSSVAISSSGSLSSSSSNFTLSVASSDGTIVFDKNGLNTRSLNLANTTVLAQTGQVSVNGSSVTVSAQNPILVSAPAVELTATTLSLMKASSPLTLTATSTNAVLDSDTSADVSAPFVTLSSDSTFAVDASSRLDVVAENGGSVDIRSAAGLVLNAASTTLTAAANTVKVNGQEQVLMTGHSSVNSAVGTSAVDIIASSSDASTGDISVSSKTVRFTATEKGTITAANVLLTASGAAYLNSTAGSIKVDGITMNVQSTGAMTLNSGTAKTTLASSGTFSAYARGSSNDLTLDATVGALSITPAAELSLISSTGRVLIDGTTSTAKLQGGSLNVTAAGDAVFNATTSAVTLTATKTADLVSSSGGIKMNTLVGATTFTSAQQVVFNATRSISLTNDATGSPVAVSLDGANAAIRAPTSLSLTATSGIEVTSDSTVLKSASTTLTLSGAATFAAQQVTATAGGKLEILAKTNPIAVQSSSGQLKVSGTTVTTTAVGEVEVSGASVQMFADSARATSTGVFKTTVQATAGNIAIGAGTNATLSATSGPLTVTSDLSSVTLLTNPSGTLNLTSVTGTSVASNGDFVISGSNSTTLETARGNVAVVANGGDIRATSSASTVSVSAESGTFTATSALGSLTMTANSAGFTLDASKSRAGDLAVTGPTGITMTAAADIGVDAALLGSGQIYGSANVVNTVSPGATTLTAKTGSLALTSSTAAVAATATQGVTVTTTSGDLSLSAASLSVLPGSSTQVAGVTVTASTGDVTLTSAVGNTVTIDNGVTLTARANGAVLQAAAADIVPASGQILVNGTTAVTMLAASGATFDSYKGLTLSSTSGNVAIRSRDTTMRASSGDVSLSAGSSMLTAASGGISLLAGATATAATGSILLSSADSATIFGTAGVAATSNSDATFKSSAAFTNLVAGNSTTVRAQTGAITFQASGSTGTMTLNSTTALLKGTTLVNVTSSTAFAAESQGMTVRSTAGNIKLAGTGSSNPTSSVTASKFTLASNFSLIGDDTVAGTSAFALTALTGNLNITSTRATYNGTGVAVAAGSGYPLTLQSAGAARVAAAGISGNVVVSAGSGVTVAAPAGSGTNGQIRIKAGSVTPVAVAAGAIGVAAADSITMGSDGNVTLTSSNNITLGDSTTAFDSIVFESVGQATLSAAAGAVQHTETAQATLNALHNISMTATNALGGSSYSARVALSDVNGFQATTANANQGISVSATSTGSSLSVAATSTDNSAGLSMTAETNAALSAATTATLTAARNLNVTAAAGNIQARGQQGIRLTATDGVSITAGTISNPTPVHNGDLALRGQAKVGVSAATVSVTSAGDLSLQSSAANANVSLTAASSLTVSAADSANGTLSHHADNAVQYVAASVLAVQSHGDGSSLVSGNTGKTVFSASNNVLATAVGDVNVTSPTGSVELTAATHANITARSETTVSASTVSLTVGGSAASANVATALGGVLLAANSPSATVMDGDLAVIASSTVVGSGTQGMTFTTTGDMSVSATGTVATTASEALSLTAAGTAEMTAPAVLMRSTGSSLSAQAPAGNVLVTANTTDAVLQGTTGYSVTSTVTDTYTKITEAGVSILRSTDVSAPQDTLTMDAADVLAVHGMTSLTMVGQTATTIKADDGLTLTTTNAGNLQLTAAALDFTADNALSVSATGVTFSAAQSSIGLNSDGNTVVTASDSTTFSGPTGVSFNTTMGAVNVVSKVNGIAVSAMSAASLASLSAATQGDIVLDSADSFYMGAGTRVSTTSATLSVLATSSVNNALQVLSTNSSVSATGSLDVTSVTGHLTTTAQNGAFSVYVGSAEQTSKAALQFVATGNSKLAASGSSGDTVQFTAGSAANFVSTSTLTLSAATSTVSLTAATANYDVTVSAPSVHDVNVTATTGSVLIQAAEDAKLLSSAGGIGVFSRSGASAATGSADAGEVLFDAATTLTLNSGADVALTATSGTASLVASTGSVTLSGSAGLSLTAESSTATLTASGTAGLAAQGITFESTASSADVSVEANTNLRVAAARQLQLTASSSPSLTSSPATGVVDISAATSGVVTATNILIENPGSSSRINVTSDASSLGVVSATDVSITSTTGSVVFNGTGVYGTNVASKTIAFNLVDSSNDVQSAMTLEDDATLTSTNIQLTTDGTALGGVSELAATAAAYLNVITTDSITLASTQGDVVLDASEYSTGNVLGVSTNAIRLATVADGTVATSAAVAPTADITVSANAELATTAGTHTSVTANDISVTPNNAVSGAVFGVVAKESGVGIYSGLASDMSLADGAVRVYGDAAVAVEADNLIHLNAEGSFKTTGSVSVTATSNDALTMTGDSLAFEAVQSDLILHADSTDNVGTIVLTTQATETTSSDQFLVTSSRAALLNAGSAMTFASSVGSVNMAALATDSTSVGVASVAASSSAVLTSEIVNLQAKDVLNMTSTVQTTLDSTTMTGSATTINVTAQIAVASLSAGDTAFFNADDTLSLTSHSLTGTTGQTAFVANQLLSLNAANTLNITAAGLLDGWASQSVVARGSTLLLHQGSDAVDTLSSGDLVVQSTGTLTAKLLASQSGLAVTMQTTGLSGNVDVAAVTGITGSAGQTFSVNAQTATFATPAAIHLTSSSAAGVLVESDDLSKFTGNSVYVTQNVAAPSSYATNVVGFLAHDDTTFQSDAGLTNAITNGGAQLSATGGMIVTSQTSGGAARGPVTARANTGALSLTASGNALSINNSGANGATLVGSTGAIVRATNNAMFSTRTSAPSTTCAFNTGESCVRFETTDASTGNIKISAQNLNLKSTGTFRIVSASSSTVPTGIQASANLMNVTTGADLTLKAPAILLASTAGSVTLQATEKVFVDSTGVGLSVTNPTTGTASIQSTSDSTGMLIESQPGMEFQGKSATVQGTSVSMTSSDANGDIIFQTIATNLKLYPTASALILDSLDAAAANYVPLNIQSTGSVNLNSSSTDLTVDVVSGSGDFSATAGDLTLQARETVSINAPNVMISSSSSNMNITTVNGDITFTPGTDKRNIIAGRLQLANDYYTSEPGKVTPCNTGELRWGSTGLFLCVDGTNVNEKWKYMPFEHMDDVGITTVSSQIVYNDLDYNANDASDFETAMATQLGVSDSNVVVTDATQVTSRRRNALATTDSWRIDFYVIPDLTNSAFDSIDEILAKLTDVITTASSDPTSPLLNFRISTLDGQQPTAFRASTAIGGTDATLTTSTNAMPQMSLSVTSISAAQGTASYVVNVTVSDRETAVNDLVVTVQNDASPLVSTATITSTGSVRFLTLTFDTSLNGTGTLSLTLRDASNAEASASVSVYVYPPSINEAPTILSTIGDRVILEDASTGWLTVTLADKEDDAYLLDYYATYEMVWLDDATYGAPPSDDLGLTFEYRGSGANRELRVTPAAAKYGVAIVTLRVVDTYGASSTDTFRLAVTQVKEDPVMSNIPDMKVKEDVESGSYLFNITYTDGTLGSLTLTPASSDNTLVKDSAILFDGDYAVHATCSDTFADIPAFMKAPVGWWTVVICPESEDTGCEGDADLDNGGNFTASTAVCAAAYGLTNAQRANYRSIWLFDVEVVASNLKKISPASTDYMQRLFGNGMQIGDIVILYDEDGNEIAKRTVTYVYQDTSSTSSSYILVDSDVPANLYTLKASTINFRSFRVTVVNTDDGENVFQLATRTDFITEDDIGTARLTLTRPTFSTTNAALTNISATSTDIFRLNDKVYIFNLTGDGTLTKTAGSNVLTTSTYADLLRMRVGYYILIGGEIRRIMAINVGSLPYTVVVGQEFASSGTSLSYMYTSFYRSVTGIKAASGSTAGSITVNAPVPQFFSDSIFYLERAPRFTFVAESEPISLTCGTSPDTLLTPKELNPPVIALECSDLDTEPDTLTMTIMSQYNRMGADNANTSYVIRCPTGCADTNHRAGLGQLRHTQYLGKTRVNLIGSYSSNPGAGLQLGLNNDSISSMAITSSGRLAITFKSAYSDHGFEIGDVMNVTQAVNVRLNYGSGSVMDITSAFNGMHTVQDVDYEANVVTVSISTTQTGTVSLASSGNVGYLWTTTDLYPGLLILAGSQSVRKITSISATSGTITVDSAYTISDTAVVSNLYQATYYYVNLNNMEFVSDVDSITPGYYVHINGYETRQVSAQTDSYITLTTALSGYVASGASFAVSSVPVLGGYNGLPFETGTSVCSAGLYAGVYSDTASDDASRTFVMTIISTTASTSSPTTDTSKTAPIIVPSAPAGQLRGFFLTQGTGFTSTDTNLLGYGRLAQQAGHGMTYAVKCPASCSVASGSISGDNTDGYTESSAICQAAVNAGIATATTNVISADTYFQVTTLLADDGSRKFVMSTDALADPTSGSDIRRYVAADSTYRRVRVIPTINQDGQTVVSVSLMSSSSAGDTFRYIVSPVADGVHDGPIDILGYESGHSCYTYGGESQCIIVLDPGQFLYDTDGSEKIVSGTFTVNLPDSTFTVFNMTNTSSISQLCSDTATCQFDPIVSSYLMSTVIGIRPPVNYPRVENGQDVGEFSITITAKTNESACAGSTCPDVDKFRPTTASMSVTVKPVADQPTISLSLRNVAATSMTLSYTQAMTDTDDSEQLNTFQLYDIPSPFTTTVGSYGYHACGMSGINRGAINCDARFSDYSGWSSMTDGMQIYVYCHANCFAATVYGEQAYAPGSSICNSAIHAGIVTQADGGWVRVTKKSATSGSTNFVSLMSRTPVTRNGVTPVSTTSTVNSGDYTNWAGIVDTPTIPGESAFTASGHTTSSTTTTFSVNGTPLLSDGISVRMTGWTVLSADGMTDVSDDFNYAYFSATSTSTNNAQNKIALSVDMRDLIVLSYGQLLPLYLRCKAFYLNTTEVTSIPFTSVVDGRITWIGTATTQEKEPYPGLAADSEDLYNYRSGATTYSVTPVINAPTVSIYSEDGTTRMTSMSWDTTTSTPTIVFNLVVSRSDVDEVLGNVVLSSLPSGFDIYLNGVNQTRSGSANFTFTHISSNAFSWNSGSLTDAILADATTTPSDAAYVTLVEIRGPTTMNPTTPVAFTASAMEPTLCSYSTSTWFSSCTSYTTGTTNINLVADLPFIVTNNTVGDEDTFIPIDFLASTYDTESGEYLTVKFGYVSGASSYASTLQFSFTSSTSGLISQNIDGYWYLYKYVNQNYYQNALSSPTYTSSTIYVRLNQADGNQYLYGNVTLSGSVTSSAHPTTSSTGQFLLTVQPTNDAPTCVTVDPASGENYATASGSVSIGEDTTVSNNHGATVGYLYAVDVDVTIEGGESHSFVFVYSNGTTGTTSPDEHFSISGNTLRRTSTDIDYETTTSFTYTIRTSDKASLTGSCSVTIDVTDVNEAPTAVSVVSPYFACGVLADGTAYPSDTCAFAVPENLNVNTIITYVRTTDVDNAHGDTHSYSLPSSSNNDTVRTYFGATAYNSTHGAVYVKTAMDYESLCSPTQGCHFTLTVQASDSGSLTYSSTYLVTLRNVNEAPTASVTTQTVTVTSLLASASYEPAFVDPDNQFYIDAGVTNPTTGEVESYADFSVRMQVASNQNNLINKNNLALGVWTNYFVLSTVTPTQVCGCTYEFGYDPITVGYFFTNSAAVGSQAITYLEYTDNGLPDAAGPIFPGMNSTGSLSITITFTFTRG